MVSQGMASMFRRAWRGEERLWKVWWLIGIPQSVVLALLYVNVLQKTPHSMVYVPALVLYIVVYFAWVRVAWLCAPNVKRGIWTAVSYVVIVLGVLNLAKTLLLN
jgi:amino acid transporter